MKKSDTNTNALNKVTDTNARNGFRSAWADGRRGTLSVPRKTAPMQHRGTLLPYVEDFSRSPTQYKDIYGVRIKFWRYLIKAAIIAACAILIYAYIPYQGTDEIKSFINGFGMAAPLVFIIVCTVKPVIFFLPSIGLTVVAGTLFGPFYGTLYVVIGGGGSTMVGFFLARAFGRKGIEQFLKGHTRLLAMDEKMEKTGFRTTLMLRLFNLPWDVVSYSAGISRVRFRDFYSASLIALVPTSFLYTYFGSSLWNPTGAGFMISLSLIILLGAIPYIKKAVSKCQSVRANGSIL